MFYLVLPVPTLTADLPNLRCLYKTTLAFRPPPDYGSGGWGFESLAARTIAYRDARRRPTGPRFAPGTGRQPRRVDNGGNHTPALWVGLPGRSKTGKGAAGSRATR